MIFFFHKTRVSYMCAVDEMQYILFSCYTLGIIIFTCHLDTFSYKNLFIYITSFLVKISLSISLHVNVLYKSFILYFILSWLTHLLSIGFIHSVNMLVPLYPSSGCLVPCVLHFTCLYNIFLPFSIFSFSLLFSLSLSSLILQCVVLYLLSHSLYLHIMC